MYVCIDRDEQLKENFLCFQQDRKAALSTNFY